MISSMTTKTQQYTNPARRIDVILMAITDTSIIEPCNTVRGTVSHLKFVFLKHAQYH